MRLRHWPGKRQAFTSLMASMRRALFVTAVVRKMNLYPEESKAPAYVTPSRPQAPTLAVPHAAPPVPQPWLDQSISLQAQTHQHHAQGKMPLAAPGGTGRPALQLTASSTQEPLPREASKCCPLSLRSQGGPTSPFWFLLPFSLPRNRRAEISEKVQPPRNATRTRRRDSLEGLSSLVKPVGIRGDLLLCWRQLCVPHPALLPGTLPHSQRPRTREGQLAAVQQPQHVIQALPAPPLQHLEDANARFKSKAAPSLGKEGCSSPAITLLVTRAAEHWHRPGTKQKQREGNTMGAGGTCSHLLNDAAAEGHISTTEDICHVPWYLQVVLAIHTWDLKCKGEDMRTVITQPCRLLESEKSSRPLRTVLTSTKRRTSNSPEK